MVDKLVLQKNKYDITKIINSSGSNQFQYINGIRSSDKQVLTNLLNKLINNGHTSIIIWSNKN